MRNEDASDGVLSVWTTCLRAWGLLARIVTPVELTIKLLRDTGIQFAQSPVSVLFLPGLFDFSRSLGVLYKSPDKIHCWPQQQQVSGWSHLRSDTENHHPVTQWGSHKCQITPSISGSNEEDYLLINAQSYLWVMGGERGWRNGKIGPG